MRSITLYATIDYFILQFVSYIYILAGAVREKIAHRLAITLISQPVSIGETGRYAPNGIN